jgi:hypothetical protein
MKNIRLILGVLLFVGGNHLLAQAPVVQNCPNLDKEYGDLGLNNAQLWNNNLFFDPSISSNDLGEATVEDQLLVRHYCAAPNPEVSFVLYLDLDFDDTLETVVKSTDVLPAGTLLFNNANNAPGAPVNFDARLVPGNEKYRFAVQTQILSDSTFSARMVWITETGTVQNVQLPYGKHRLEWLIGDGCGNITTCQYNLRVKDIKRPTVVCQNGISVNLTSLGVVLWASDLLQYTEDNYTSVQQLVIAVRRIGEPDGLGNTTGFPLKADGTPQTQVSFDCDDIGTVLVELWSRDKSGNTDYCETYVVVKDDFGNCGFQPVFDGKVTFCGGTAGVKDVHVGVSGGGNGTPGNAMSVLTDENGNFSFSGLPIASNACITATKEINPTNGVNTFDNVLISRHILGIQPLDSPYKLIAADANKSGTISTFDIVEVHKLILGIYTQFPNNSSWRFVDAAQVFANPANPFAEIIQECIQIVNLDSMPAPFAFVGVKVGDVDCGANPQNLTGVASDRSVITFPDQILSPGEEITLTFPGGNTFSSWQMTLQLKGLELVEFINLDNLTASNFAYFPGADTNKLTFATELADQQFQLRLKAITGGPLSSLLSIINDITPSFSYDDNGNPSPITLEFTSNTTEIPVFSANLTPNPWTMQANLQFTAAQSGTGIFTVSNALGQVIYTEKQTYSAGPHTISLSRQQIPVAGTYWCRLALNGQVQVVKMVVQQ